MIFKGKWVYSEYGKELSELHKKYGIDSMKLSHSQDYYSKNPDLYLSIHKNILKRMKMNLRKVLVISLRELKIQFNLNLINYFLKRKERLMKK